MGLREDLQKRIDRKLEESRELELRIRENQAYVQGLQDTMKMLPRDSQLTPAPLLRAGTDLAKAQDCLRKVGRPLHISELLKALGKPINNVNRAGLSGNISAYVRRGQVFTRPAPNTFGLIELEDLAASGTRPPGPPPNFGLVEETPDDDASEEEPPGM